MKLWADCYAPLLGRILVGGYFLWNGIVASINFPTATEKIIALGMPAPVEVALLVVLVEVLGGIALVVGYQTRVTALLLAVYMTGFALLSIDLSSDVGETIFLQSMAIAGGLMFMSAYGDTLWNLPTRSRKK